MSLLWCDGFEDNTLVSYHYSDVNISGATSVTSRSGSGNAIQHAVSGGNSWRKQVDSADEHATFIVGMYIKFGTSVGATKYFSFQSDDGATEHVYIDSNGSGELRAYRGGTLLGTTTGANLIASTGYFIEVKVYLHDSAGTVEIKVNGTSRLALTGQDTKNAGTKAVFDSFKHFSRSNTGQWTVIDDLYICNGAGSSNNDFLGDCQVETLRPSGNGNSSQWTGSDGNSTDNYLLVDEATLSLTDFVEETTANEKDLYVHADLAAATATIKGVMARGIMSKTATGTKQARHIARTAATDYAGTTQTLVTSESLTKNVWDTNPNTTNAWSLSEVNGAEFGVECL